MLQTHFRTRKIIRKPRTQLFAFVLLQLFQPYCQSIREAIKLFLFVVTLCSIALAFRLAAIVPTECSLKLFVHGVFYKYENGPLKSCINWLLSFNHAHSYLKFVYKTTVYSSSFSFLLFKQTQCFPKLSSKKSQKPFFSRIARS